MPNVKPTAISKPLIAVLPGDGIGREIIPQAVAVLRALELDVVIEEAPVGGAGLDAKGDPLPPETLDLAMRADAVLFGAVGGPEYDHWPRTKRAGSGLLRLRRELGLFANLRPARLFPTLVDSSPLKPQLLDGLDLLIVRELMGDAYFGEPRGELAGSQPRRFVNTISYDETEIRRIAHVAFVAARRRRRRLVSVDKANVLETMAFWRDIVEDVARDYPDVEFSHLFVDAAAMALIKRPAQFDVILTGNMFGDILSDATAALVGSIGLMPSASFGSGNKGLYEPIHGSAPDIAGRGVANPIGAILSAAMMLRLSLNRSHEADRIESAVNCVLENGLRTPDIATPATTVVGTARMGEAIVNALSVGARAADIRFAGSPKSQPTYEGGNTR